MTSCEKDYPLHPSCDSYPYENENAAFDAIQRQYRRYGLPPLRKHRCEDDAHSCNVGEGTHTNVPDSLSAWLIILVLLVSAGAGFLIAQVMKNKGKGYK